MSKQTFEALDLLIFTAITAVFEAINVWAFQFFGSNAVYYISIAAAMGMIAVFRWNYLGLVVAPVAGAAGVFVRNLMAPDKVTMNLWLAMTIGYLGLSVCLLFFIKKSKKELRDSIPWMILYYLSGYAAVEVIRALCQIGNGEFFTIAWQYFSLDLLNVAFGAALFFIARKQQNLVVDMNQYLIDLHNHADFQDVEAIKKSSRYTVQELAEDDEINDAALLEGSTLSQDDLKKLEADRRRIEGKKSKYEREREEKASYLKHKGEGKHNARKD